MIVIFVLEPQKKIRLIKSEYRRIEYNLPVNVAIIAKENSVNSFFYVSSIGANPKASSGYLKNKGQERKN